MTVKKRPYLLDLARLFLEEDGITVQTENDPWEERVENKVN